MLTNTRQLVAMRAIAEDTQQEVLAGIIARDQVDSDIASLDESTVRFLFRFLCSHFDIRQAYTAQSLHSRFTYFFCLIFLHLS